MIIIYLDSMAYHPILSQVQEKICDILPQLANPSSAHSMGRKIRNEIELARESICQALNCDISNIIFTSGASESNSTISYNANQSFHGMDMEISAFEHDSVNGVISDNYDFHTLVNNENGCNYFSNLYKQQKYLYGVDATAALGNIKLDLSNPFFNFASFSAEKTGSISGGGLLYINDITNFHQMIYGEQEHKLRGGTENILSIIGMGISIPWCVENLEKKHEHCSILKNELLNGLKNLDFICNSNDDCVPSIISLSFKGIDGHSLMEYLDMCNIEVSNGSACNSNSLEPSKTLKVLGVPNEYINGTIRISTSLFNTIDEIKYASNKICDFINLMKV